MKIYRAGEGPAIAPQTTVPLPPKVSEKPKAAPQPAAAQTPQRAVSKAPAVDASGAPVRLTPSVFERELILDTRVRALGLIPVLSLVLHFLHKAYVEFPPRVGELLWMCHVSAVLLAVGLLASAAGMIRIGAAWSILGLPSFILGVFTTDPSEISRLSWLSHLVLPLLAMLVMTQVRMDRRPLGFYVGTSMAVYALAAGMARVFTAPRWNVNVVHKQWALYPGMDVPFPVFYAIVLVLLTGLVTAYFIAARRLLRPDEGPEPAKGDERTPIAASLRRGY